MNRTVLDFLKKIFTVDLRALSLMRIGIGLILLTDIIIRATDLKAHYSNEGVLPLDVLFRYNWNPWHLSIHTISGTWQIQGILFFIAGLFALSLTLGWKTRLSTIVSWFLLFSLHNRNPLILQGGDDLLRMTLFWAMFLPWGKFYSIDQKNEATINYSYSSMATAGYILQIIFVYFFSALLKNSPEWRIDGTAIYYALSLDQIVFPLGKLIYPYQSILKYLTLSVFYIELLIPFLLLLPFFTKQFRIAVIIILTAFHIGISSTLFVGLFFLIGIVTLFGLYPSSWMDHVDEKYNEIVNRIKLKFWFLQFLYNHNTSYQVSAPSQLSGIRDGFLLFCLIYSLLWNVHTTDRKSFQIPEGIAWVGNLIRLDQCWGMFAPSVFKDDGWFILEGVTEHSKLIDLNRDGFPVNYKKPENGVSLFKNDRWRKYSENYLFVSRNYMRPYFCDFKLKEWNESHPDKKIVNLRVVYMKEVTLPDYKYSKPKREVLAYTAH